MDFQDGQVKAIENVEPYALFGDRNGDFKGGGLVLGEGDYALDLDFFEGRNGQGPIMESAALDFALI
jgi:hypothetical protein